MILNRVWIALFITGTLTALGKLFFFGDLLIFKQMVDGLFETAETGFTIALYLTGALCLWMGVMKIGEDGGAINLLAKAVSPLFRKLFPEVPADHPANGAMIMNFSANMLGLDNAATPLGLKAMKELQELNPDKEKASNAQIMFLVLNTSGLTIIPVSILAYRTAAGSGNPTEVFLPILFATFFSSLAGLIYVAVRQRISLFNKTVIAYLGTLTVLICALLWYIVSHPENTETIANIGGNLLIFLIIILFIILGIRKKVNVYESFVEGAKGGFDVAIKIVPYLVAILIAISVFRTSGAFDVLLDGIRALLIGIGMTFTEFVDALPVAFMKPLSGGGARGLMLETFSRYGVDSFAGKLAATFQGSTETTFYVLSVYFGSVNIRNSRYAVAGGLIADFAGIIAAIVLAYLFYSVN